MTFCVVFFDGWMDNTGFDIVVDHARRQRRAVFAAADAAEQTVQVADHLVHIEVDLGQRVVCRHVELFQCGGECCKRVCISHGGSPSPAALCGNRLRSARRARIFCPLRAGYRPQTAPASRRAGRAARGQAPRARRRALR